MKPYSSILLTLMLVIASQLSHAEWDKKCLDDCFGTHHECDYCSYQCEVDGHQKMRVYPTSTCPLAGYGD